jgi:RNA-directed DNA polymerase
VRLDNARKLQRTLYRVAKQQPRRRFTLLYDKVCRQDILREAWQRVKFNKGAAGVDKIDIEAIRDYGEERFLAELEQELRSRCYRTALVRRVHIPKPGQPDKTRPLGIPTVKDRVVQMAVKIVIEPLFEADFLPCSFGFRPKRAPRMALSAIVQSVNEGCSQVVDVDLKSYFDTIDHQLLMRLVDRRVGDVQILRLIRAWLKAGVMEEGRVTHPDRGSPQGGVISPLLSNIFLHEVDRRWCRSDGVATGSVRLVRYADDMVLLAQTEQQARTAWDQLQREFADLHLVVNQEKSRLTTLTEGFAFLGFEFRKAPGRMLLMWPRRKACCNIRQRVREVVRSFPSNGPVDAVIRKLNPVLNGWCTYFRVGNSNRTFHKIDWAVRSEMQLWLRRKHRCPWGTARGSWNYHVLHERCRLYRMVGKVSHLEGLRRTPSEEGDRRAGCGKSASPVR